MTTIYTVTCLSANAKPSDALGVFVNGFKTEDEAEQAILKDLKVCLRDNEIDETPNTDNMYEIAKQHGLLYEIHDIAIAKSGCQCQSPSIFSALETSCRRCKKEIE